MKTWGRFFCAAAALLLVCSAGATEPGAKTATNAGTTDSAKPAKIVFTEQQLEKFSRALKQPNASAAYVQLSAAASRKSSGTLGIRAALALGYYDYGKGNYAQAAKWLAKAESDPLLADNALYWAAETDLAEGHSGVA